MSKLFEVELCSLKLASMSEDNFRKRRHQPDFQRAIQLEHKNIVSNQDTGTYENFLKEENKRKNRYNIPCWDETRVKITPKNGDTDYIHANYVDHYKKANKYVTTQGPLKNTVNQFWQMIWEQESHVIVMLTELQVDGVEKCAQYWNPIDNEIFQADELSIKKINETQKPGYIKRTLEVSHSTTKESRKITHYQYVDWPECGVPSNHRIFMDFILEVNAKQAEDLCTPVIIHCSSGIDKTGTYCAVDSCMYKLTTGQVAVPLDVTIIRRQRHSSVATSKQYAFIYEMLYKFSILFEKSPDIRKRVQLHW